MSSGSSRSSRSSNDRKSRKLKTIKRKQGHGKTTKGIKHQNMTQKLAKKKAGLRSLLDVIPLDASLVRGSHGRAPTSAEAGPMLMTSRPGLIGQAELASTQVYEVLKRHVLD